MKFNSTTSSFPTTGTIKAYYYMNNARYSVNEYFAYLVNNAVSLPANVSKGTTDDLIINIVQA